MKIGIVSPFMPHTLIDLLDESSRRKLASIKGVTATPVSALAREWHSQGHEISIFCLDPSVFEPCQLSGERLSIHVLPKRRFRQSAMDFYRKEREFIREAVQKEKPDVLSAQWSYEHALGALDTGLPTVVTCHDTPLRYAWISKNLFMAYHILVAATVFRRADHLIAVSPYTANHIERYFLPKAKPIVIPNGLPEDIFHRGATRLRDSKSNASNPYTLCTVAGWGHIKNTQTVMRAFAEIRKSHPTIRLVLIGSELGPGQAAEQWARQHRLTDGIEFRGRASREEILDFLASEVDLMIHPSLVECHPMVLIEAIACGVPVLAGKSSGGVAWTLGEGRHGTLCDVTKPTGIAKAALSIITAESNHKPSPAEAWQGIRDEAGIDRIATHIAEHLERIRNAPAGDWKRS